MIDDREQLLRRLRKAGQAEEDLDRAAAEGRLSTLAVEVALGGAVKHTLTSLARAAGVDARFLREMMQAIGRPNPAPRERVFTDDDLHFAKLVRRLMDAGLPKWELLEVGRVMSLGSSQSADAVRRLVGNAMLEPGDSEFTVGLRFAEAAEELGPLVPSLLNYHFRAQLRDGIRRELVTEAEREAGTLAGTREVAVAFADLVGYTRLGERMPAEDLGHIAGRLSELAARAAERPVQVVKMIGDAAMFVSADTAPLLDTMVALVEGVEAEGEGFPGVRVGVAHGPATNRSGDWFGSTVNLASRVTDRAKPGRILASEAVRELVPERSWKRTRRRSLKGVDGRVSLLSLDWRAEAE